MSNHSGGEEKVAPNRKVRKGPHLPIMPSYTHETDTSTQKPAARIEKGLLAARTIEVLVSIKSTPPRNASSTFTTQSRLTWLHVPQMLQKPAAPSLFRALSICSPYRHGRTHPGRGCADAGRCDCLPETIGDFRRTIGNSTKGPSRTVKNESRKQTAPSGGAAQKTVCRTFAAADWVFLVPRVHYRK